MTLSVAAQLAVALDATGEREEAEEIYVKLRRSPIAAVRKRAKQFEFQKEAVSFLKVPTCLTWSNLGRSRPILA